MGHLGSLIPSAVSYRPIGPDALGVGLVTNTGQHDAGLG